MIVKSAAAGIAGSVLLASVAFAQSPAAPSDTTRNSPAATSGMSTPSTAQSGWRASKMVGLKVYNNANESIGDINDILTDHNGKITSVVLGVGGFLGIGEHLVAIPFEKVKFVDQPVANTSASTAPARPANSTTTTGAATTTTTTTTTSATKTNPWYPDHAVFNATKEELKAMPEFKYST